MTLKEVIDQREKIRHFICHVLLKGLSLTEKKLIVCRFYKGYSLKKTSSILKMDPEEVKLMFEEICFKAHLNLPIEIH